VFNEEFYRAVRRNGFEKKVWEHTNAAFEEIQAGRVFKG
jgi:hypothetical protein